MRTVGLQVCGIRDLASSGLSVGLAEHRMLRGLALRAGLDVMCIQLQGGERLPQHTKASEVLVRLVEHSL